MTPEKMLQIAKKNLKTMLLLGMLLGASSFLFLVMSQKNFKSGVDLLIVQNQTGNADYFTLSKSSEYISSILMESIYSEKFLEEVKSSGVVSSQFVSLDKTKKLKDWKKIVRVKKSPTVGMVKVSVYANSQKQAAEISSAIISVLESQSSQFLGAGQAVEIRVLSGPIIEKNPSGGEIVLVGLGGFLVGIILVFFGAIILESIKNEENENVPIFTDEKEEIREDGRIMSFREAQPLTEDEDYFSPNSDYWKKRLNNLR